MNDPDDDDSYSDYVSDRICGLSEHAESNRMIAAESIFDAPDDDDTPDVPDVWIWLWNNRRADYHREMSRAILEATDEQATALLKAYTVDYGRDVPGEFDNADA